MISSRKATVLRVAGSCGVIGPLVALSSVSLAILNSPWFSWAENALSDLGVDGIAAILFNSGLIVGGLLTAIFALGLRETLRDQTLGHIGTLILTSAAANLCAIGIFPETAGILHLLVSVAFFVLLPTSLLFIGVGMTKMPLERDLGLFTILVGLVAGLVWTLPLGGGLAIPESLTALAASLWSIVLGVKLIKQA